MFHRVISIVCCAVLFISCKQEMKFDKKLWNSGSDGLYPSPNREMMLKDLTKNHQLVGLTTKELKDLLGAPDYNDSNTLQYEIMIDYGHDIDPVAGSDLELHFNKDSVITSFEVNEYHH